MPSAIASATKQALRNAVAARVGDRNPFFTTTAAGTTTTVVSTDLTEWATNAFRGRWVLDEDGAALGTYRPGTTFDPSTGTITVSRAWASAPGSGKIVSLWKYEPRVYTLAANAALASLWPLLYKLETDYVLADSERRSAGLPRGMVSLWRVAQEAEDSERLTDLFNRADSASSIGGSWAATTGTWGVSSERGYSVTDADGGMITYDLDAGDGMIVCTVRGTLNSGATYRTPSLCFRIFEDYLGAIATANYLLVRLLNGVVDLRKVDASSESSLTTASLTTSDDTDYVLRVRFEGTRIRVWVDDIERISYNLTGLNTKYLSGRRVGVRWDKGGSPATAARIDDFRAHTIVPFVDHHDWRLSPGRQVVDFGVIGQWSGLVTGRWLQFEGGAPMSRLTADTTPGSLASDTTATMEITADDTDPEWELLVNETLVKLYQFVSTMAYGGTPEDRAELGMERDRALANTRELRRRLGMPHGSAGRMYSY